MRHQLYEELWREGGRLFGLFVNLYIEKAVEWMIVTRFMTREAGKQVVRSSPLMGIELSCWVERGGVNPTKSPH